MNRSLDVAIIPVHSSEYYILGPAKKLAEKKKNKKDQIIYHLHFLLSLNSKNEESALIK